MPASGQVIWSTPEPVSPYPEAVLAVAYSLDGSRVASGVGDGTIRVWNVDTGSEERRFEAAGPVASVAYSPDNSHVVAASNPFDLDTFELVGSTVLLWNVATRAEALRLEVEGEVHSVAYSPDGSHVAFATTTFDLETFTDAGSPDTGRVTC